MRSPSLVPLALVPLAPVLLAALLGLPVAVLASPASGSAPQEESRRVPPGADLTGTYDCTGVDASEGPYTATVTLTRRADHSVDGYVAYDYLLEVPGFGRYPGEAVAQGSTLAIHFALTDPAPHDFGTGIARVSRKAGRPAFHKFYYEPEFKGGNHGTEDCRRR